MKIRYCADSLPPYAFIPGLNAHPLKEGGHMFESGEPKSTPLTNDNYLTHPHFLYAIDLFNHQFFWESHVFFEAIWNANKRVGPWAEFCKAIIQFAASEIKKIQKKEEAASAHYNRAQELLLNECQTLEHFIELENLYENLYENLDKESLYKDHPIIILKN